MRRKAEFNSRTLFQEVRDLNELHARLAEGMAADHEALMSMAEEAAGIAILSEGQLGRDLTGDHYSAPEGPSADQGGPRLS